ncbi:MAG: Trm112 family protein [Desulfobulbaceae bacterium]|nr:Trm112 family protein [Desulfobulbaceae bacterium]
MIKQELIDILVCPKCKGRITLNTEQNGLLCETCKLLYPISDEGIPIMLIDKAKSLD